MKVLYSNAAVLIPAVGTVMALRGRIWQWGAALGFALWLMVNLVGNLVSWYLVTFLSLRSFYVGLAALPLQVLSLAVALRALTGNRTAHRWIGRATAGYLIALGAAVSFSEMSHLSMVYLFRSPYALLVAFGCGFAFIERTGSSTLRFWQDGPRVALAGVLTAAVPVLVLELVMWGLMEANDMVTASNVSQVRYAMLLVGYVLVTWSFRNPWTFARSG